MERLTLSEFYALSERHTEALRREDFFHARTSTAITGGSPQGVMIYKAPQESPLPKDPVSFNDVLKKFL